MGRHALAVRTPAHECQAFTVLLSTYEVRVMLGVSLGAPVGGSWVVVGDHKQYYLQNDNINGMLKF